MKGPELAERLSTVSPETPVLFMCGYVDNKAVGEQFLYKRVRSALDF
jgi:FixJ family two-component response regulator